MEKLLKLMNQEVANLGVLYTKLHSYHWFVKGPNFYQLHELFEKLYDETTEQFDEVAERILMLDGRPAATLKEFLALATISEATAKETANEMLHGLLADYVLLDGEFATGIALAEEAGDDVTADLFVGLRATVQKHIWMLKTTLA